MAALVSSVPALASSVVALVSCVAVGTSRSCWTAEHHSEHRQRNFVTTLALRAETWLRPWDAPRVARFLTSHRRLGEHWPIIWFPQETRPH